ncbi:MAG: DUF1640 domain-containing protein [Magnetococcales bacterium]|nr:DUF1640 domain-containing protein [Magnetococcales bacterium]
MHAITFDTFKFVRRLKDAGMPESQAEAISDALKETHAITLDEMASKRDLRELEAQLATKADLAKVDMHVLELKRDIRELELRMKEQELRIIIRFGLMLVAVAGGLFAALRYFPPPYPYVISQRQLPTIEQGIDKVPLAIIPPAPPRAAP